MNILETEAASASTMMDTDSAHSGTLLTLQPDLTTPPSALCANQFDDIDTALAFIGQTLRIDRISLFEFEDTGKTAAITHKWTASDAQQYSPALRQIPADQLALREKADSRGVQYCPDTTALPPAEQVESGIRAFLRCPLVRGERTLGRIDFEDTSGRAWTQQEVDAQILASRLLSECLQQERLARILRHAHMETRKFLNKLHSLVYVVSRTGYRILHANDYMQRQFPDIALNALCYKAIWKREAPCPFCPLEEMAELPFYKTILYGTSLGPAMDLSVSQTLWSDETPAFLMLLSKHVLTPREQEQEKRKEAIARALSTSYDTVIDINPEAGTYEFLSPVNPEKVPRIGTYEVEIPIMCRRYAAAVYEEELITTFSLANMHQVFATGIREISLDYQWHTPEGLRWKHRRAVPYELADGTRHIIAYSHDIMHQKETEHQRLQTEKTYRIALQASYTEIYEIHPGANTILCLQSSANTDDCMTLSGNLQQDLQYFGKAHVHPEDKEAFFEHYNRAALSALLSSDTRAGKTRLREYRILQSDGEPRWFSSRILPLIGEAAPQNEMPYTRALILIRDISEKKRQEEQQRIVTQYDRALRNIYESVYELNLARNTYRTIHSTGNKPVALPKEGPFKEHLDKLAATLVHPEDSERFLLFCDQSRIKAAFASGKEFLINDFRRRREDGSYRWISLTLFPMPPAGNGEETYLLFTLDISDRKQAEEIVQQNILLERQRTAAERYRIIVEQTKTLVFEWNQKNNTRYYSPEIATRFRGTYSADRDIRMIWQEDDVICKEDLPLLHECSQVLHDGASRAEMRCRLYTHDGQAVWCKVAIAALRDENGEVCRIIGTINDVDEATRSMNTLKFQAKYDMLTGILNAQAFYAAAEQLITNAPDTTYRIVRMDIERFKIVNDLYGLKEGDKLLRAIAGLLAERLGQHGVYGRLGGDVFCMCVDFNEKELLRIVDSISGRLAEYPLPYRITPAFGICSADTTSTPISVLCDWANIALKTIKGNSIKSYAFYNDTLRSRLFQEKKIESEMHEALQSGQFTVFLQPKVSIESSRIIGAEALVRWQHPIEGMLVPDTFVPLFERNGFIVRLDEYVWEQTCIALRRWLDKGYDVGAISVNVSRMHFHEVDFWKKLVALVEKYRIPPRLLELELTETVFLENATHLGDAMQALQDYGFQLSMDDFGSGYSSLTMLKNLPIDIIKIDRSFLQEGVSTEQGRIIIQHILSMAKQMQLKSIAEGVETEDQARFLLESGCTTAQGFYYSRPVPIEIFEELAFKSETTMQPPLEVIHDKEDVSPKKMRHS